MCQIYQLQNIEMNIGDNNERALYKSAEWSLRFYSNTEHMDMLRAILAVRKNSQINIIFSHVHGNQDENCLLENIRKYGRM